MKMAKKGSSIQALYDLCRKTFSPSGTHPPSSQAINKLSSLLGISLFLLLCLIASLSEIFTQILDMGLLCFGTETEKFNK